MVSGELISRLRRGDSGAFEEVVRTTYRQVYTLALRLVGDRQDAEDVAQDAYMRALRGLSGFREDAAFETWMYRIVTNAAMSHLRRRGRFGELLTQPEDGQVEVPGPTRLAEEAVDRDSVSRALEALPAQFRTVVVLKDIYGFSCAEIGDRLDMSEGAVKVRLHRARRRLKDIINGQEAPGEM